MSKPSVGSKIADLWYDKLGAKGLGDATGAGVGGFIGHATGIPEAGLGGAYLGKEILGPAFASIIKPLMEKGASMPAFQGAMSYGKAVLKGDHALTNAAASVFGAGAKTIPAHLFPDEEHIDKLDKRLKDVSMNQSQMLNVAGNLGTYMPGHAQAVSQTAMNAVNYLNSQRPINPKANPLDSDIPVSETQMAPYRRTLTIAEQPLTAIQHVRDGTLLPQDVNTLKTLYPAYYDKMSQKLMGAMTDHVSGENTVPYRTRQSVSLFLGQPMDSTMTPRSIQAIQAMYAQNKTSPQPQSQGKPKKGAPSKLGKIATNMATPEQARAERAMKG